MIQKSFDSTQAAKPRIRSTTDERLQPFILQEDGGYLPATDFYPPQIAPVRTQEREGAVEDLVMDRDGIWRGGRDGGDEALVVRSQERIARGAALEQMTSDPRKQAGS